MSSPAYAPLPSGPSAPIPNPSYDPTPTPPKLPSPRRLAFYAAVPLLYTLVLLILPNPPRTPPSSSPGDRNDTLPLPLDIFPSFTSIAFVHLVLLGLLGSLPWTSLFLLAPETRLDHYGVQWSEGNVIVVSNFVAWTSYLVYGGRSPDLDSQAFVCFCMVMVHIFGLMGLNICESPVPLHLWRKREREREGEGGADTSTISLLRSSPNRLGKRLVFPMLQGACSRRVGSPSSPRRRHPNADRSSAG
jgi:hypothetical protein